jgi:hypothetical protein
LAEFFKKNNTLAQDPIKAIAGGNKPPSPVADGKFLLEGKSE